MYNQPYENENENQNLNNEQFYHNHQPIDNSKQQISLTKFVVGIILLTIVCLPIILFCFMMSFIVLMAGDSGRTSFLETLMIAVIHYGLLIIPTAIYIYAILSEWRKYKPHPYSKSWEIYNKIMKVIAIISCIALVGFMIFLSIQMMAASSRL